MSSSHTLRFLTLPAFLGLLLLPTPGMGSSANSSNATARHFIPDGSWEEDFVDTVNTAAWFSIPVYQNHAYSIEVYVPNNYGSRNIADVDFSVFESDGTTIVIGAGVNEKLSPPSLNEDGIAGGARRSLTNFGADRFIRIQIFGSGHFPVPVAGISFHLRATDLTQTAARWTTNGYTMLIALNNSSRTTATGFVNYYSEGGVLLLADFYSLAADGSVQISHAANVMIGGVLFGGIRVTPNSGAPGTITAHEYNFNAAVGNYLSFPFSGRQWVTATPSQ